MAGNVTVPLWRIPNGKVTFDPNATVGAVVGVNLRWPDGRLVDLGTLPAPTAPPVPTLPEPPGGGSGGGGSNPSPPVTYWRLIQEVPPRVSALADSTGFGLYVITAENIGVTRNLAEGPGIAIDEVGSEIVISAIGAITINFAYGDASPTTVYVLPADMEIVAVDLQIEQAFNGTGAQIALGTLAASGLLMPQWANAPSQLGNYRATPRQELEAGTAIRLTITPGSGATQGRGQFVLSTAPTH